MAIDPRITSGIRVPDAGNVIAKFNQNMQNNAEQKRIAELHPLRVQQAEQAIESNQQGIDQNRATQRIQNIHQTGQRLKPIIESGDIATATKFMLDHVSSLQGRIEAGEKIDITESLETLQNLQAGNSQQVLQDINSVEGIINQQSGNAQQTRVTSSKILDDGTTVQSLSTGGTNVISPSGEVLEGAERTDALNSALQSKVQHKGDIAQATSDVKIAEVVTLETESAQIAQDIAAKKVTIDETKFKNAEKRDQVINAKNARRKEADSAMLQIDGLLEGDRFSKAFGKVVTTTPELLRTQGSIDAIADVNQIKGLITLESRQKLKGQGTITDSEQKILAQSATVLDNPLISDERARKELRKIKRVFEDSSDRNQLKRETKDRIEAEAAQPETQNQVIRFDAQGNIIQ